MYRLLCCCEAVVFHTSEAHGLSCSTADTKDCALMAFSHLEQLRVCAVHVPGVGQAQERPANHQVAHHCGQVCKATGCGHTERQ